MPDNDVVTGPRLACAPRQQQQQQQQQQEDWGEGWGEIERLLWGDQAAAAPSPPDDADAWREALKGFVEQLGVEYAEGRRIGLDAGQQAATHLDLAAAALALGFVHEHRERLARLEEQMWLFARTRAAREVDRLYPGNSVGAALRAGRIEALEV